MKLDRFRLFSISLSWSWLIVFAIIPFILIFMISFMAPSDASMFSFKFNVSNYTNLISYTYFKIFLRSFILAGTCTLITLIIGYPFAYIIAHTKEHIKNLLLVLVIIPFWTSSLIRSYAMIAILKTKGIINTLLLTLGIIHTPLQLLYTNTAVLIGLIYNLLPFMVLPLYANIERLDHNLVDAARDLGANWLTTFRRVIIPQTLPGIISGCIIVLLPAMTLFYIPDILGGAKSMLLGNLIQDQFLFANNWPQGAAISVILTFLMMILLWFYWRNTKAKDRHAFL